MIRCVVPLLSVLALLIRSTVAAASGIAADTTFWTSDRGSTILSVLEDGDRIYVGGAFETLGPPSGAGVPVDLVTGAVTGPYPKVNGEVFAVEGDGSGGWFIGGAFDRVGGRVRLNLAHILADGSVADWAPDPELQVGAILRMGDTLFVGGDFNIVGGLPRAHLVALSVSDPVPLAWRCDVNSRVTSLVANDTTLFVGGWFNLVSGLDRTSVVALDRRTGAVRSMLVSIDNHVKALGYHHEVCKRLKAT